MQRLDAAFSEDEVQRIRRVISRIEDEEAKAAHARHAEKIDNPCSEAKRALEDVLDRCLRLKKYRHAEYVKEKSSRTILRIPAGYDVGFGWADHMSGAANYFYKTFEFWGFASIQEFYSLPIQSRTQFFEEAIALFEGIFGENAQGLSKLIDDADEIDDPVKLKLLCLQAEDIRRETKAAFAEIASMSRIKTRDFERS